MDKLDYKKILEGKSISKKIDLIDEYDFEDNPLDYQYIVKFIKRESVSSTNEWYIISLIDLAGQLQLKDKYLIKNYLHYLEKGHSYYLKLTVLDYLSNMLVFYKDENIDYSLIAHLLENKSERLVVKIIASLILILIYPNMRMYYWEKIKQYIKKSEDYRTHIRLYNYIVYDNIPIPISKIKEYIIITESKTFSNTRAVQEALRKIRQYIAY
ncbi:MAG: hypothetical protein LUH22_19750 [Bacteroides sp.]|nr:hypothetical protein [Bacteroides sp.]